MSVHLEEQTYPGLYKLVLASKDSLVDSWANEIISLESKLCLLDPSHEAIAGSKF